MTDKSPRNSMSEKSGKSIKEKRSKGEAASQIESVIHPRKR